MTVWIWENESKTLKLRNHFVRDSKIWTYSADWEESLKQWKEIEERDSENVVSECSVEGGEVDSNY
mgnify:CR=1 FL=1